MNLHKFLRTWRGGYYRLCEHRYPVGLRCPRLVRMDYRCEKHQDDE